MYRWVWVRMKRIGILTSFLTLLLPVTTGHSQVSQKSAASNVVKFEVGYERTLPIGLAQKWLKKITDAGADGVRLILNPNSEVEIRANTDKKKTTINVSAKIDRRQNLVVKGRSFSLSDSESLKRWIANLRALESTDPEKQKGAFGLTASELVSVYEILGKPYPKSTRDQTVPEVVRTIRASLGVRIAADTAAIEALKDAEKGDDVIRVPEELEGLSCGTVLAAVIRPLGLVFVIQDKGKSFAIVDSRSVKEHWPIGWPIQKRPSQIAPILFKQTEVEIDGFKLDEVLQAIEGKTKIPFVYDQNSMARHGIELGSVPVNLGRQKTFYDKLIRLCLNQSKPGLKSELRADETGQPFLWISK